MSTTLASAVLASDAVIIEQHGFYYLGVEASKDLDRSLHRKGSNAVVSSVTRNVVCTTIDAQVMQDSLTAI